MGNAKASDCRTSNSTDLTFSFINFKAKEKVLRQYIYMDEKLKAVGDKLDSALSSLYKSIINNSENTRTI